MGHTEVAQAPGQSGDDGEEVIGGGTGGRIGAGEGQVAGQGLGVLHDGPQAPGLDRGVDQDEQNGNGHDDALDQVRDGGCQEAAGGGIAHDDNGRDDHSPHVVHPEEAGEQLAAGGEAGGRIGDEEDNNNHRGNGGQDVLAVVEPVGEELGQGEGSGDLGIPADPAGGEEPVQVSTQAQADGGPAYVRQAAEVGKARKTHEQVAGHIRGFGAHGRNQRTQLSSAQVEVGAGFVLLGEAGTDPEHSYQVNENGDGDTDGGSGHFFSHPLLNFSWGHCIIGITI